jgi:hypothetical protein
MMTAAAIQEKADHAEVVCLFCGSRTPAPAPKPARRSAKRVSEKNFRVSLVRCHVCLKEAPYQFSAFEGYDDETKAAAAGAD